MTFGHLLIIFAKNQGDMTKCRNFPTKCFVNHQLFRCVCNVVITTDNVRDFHQVSRPEVAVYIHGGKEPTIKSKIACGVKNSEDLQALADAIQKNVRDNLENYVGFPVGDVEVTFTDPGEAKTEQIAG